MNNLIIGYGEIGRAVHEIIGKSDIYDSKEGLLSFDVKDPILHVCFPYSDNFIEQLRWYISGIKPKHVVIYSTVPIGTTRVFSRAIHSPVEGKHPDLAESIRLMPRWIGANDPIEALFFENYFSKLGLKTRVLPNSNFTEFLKLRSTAKYGINLAWTDYESKVADDIGMDFKLINEFDKDYNKLYHELGMDNFKRYLLTPPNGKIGGHCIIPNAKLLSDQYPDELLTILKDME